MKNLLPVLFVLFCVNGASAIPLDLDNPNGIAVLYSTGGAIGEDQTYVVCVDGTGYRLRIEETTDWVPFNPSPVPLSDVMNWTPWMLYTNDGRWFARGSSTDPWEEFGVDIQIPIPPCYQAVANEKQSLGSLKSNFR